MKVIAQTLGRECIDVIFDQPNPTVGDLKQKLQDIKKHPAEQIKVIFSGEQLTDNNKLLSDYEIKDGTKVVILLQKLKSAIPTPEIKTPEPVQQQPIQQPNINLPNTGNWQNMIQSLTQAMNFASPAIASDNDLQSNGFPTLDDFPQEMTPELSQMLQNQSSMLSNPEFMQYMNQMVSGMNDDDYLDSDVEAFGLTQEQKQDLEEIMATGFGSYDEIIQYYVAFGYDKNATVNALLDNKFND